MGENDLLIKAKPQLNVKEFQDLYLRKNFENLKSYFSSENQLLGFKFFEVNFTAAANNQKISHGIGVTPQDVILTRLTGSGTLTLNWGLFDNKNIDVSVSGPCRVRFFVGSYWNFNSSVNSSTEDSQQFSSILSQSSSSGGTFTVSTSPIVNNYTVQIGDANKVLIFNAFLKQLTVTLPKCSDAVGKGEFVLQKIDTSFNNVQLVVGQIGDSFDDLTNILNLSTYKDTLRLVSTGGKWVVIDRAYSRAYTDLGWTSLQLTSNGLLNPITLNGTTTLPTQLSGRYRRDGNWCEVLFGFRNGTGAGGASGTPGPISLPLPGVTVIASQNPVIGPLRWDQNGQPRDGGLSLGQQNGTVQVFQGGTFQATANAQVQTDFYFNVQNSGSGNYYTVANMGLGFAMNGKMFFPVLGWGA